MNDRLKFINQDLPVVCTLTETEQASRLTETNMILNNCAKKVELEDGYAFRFDNAAQWAGELLEFIRAERECCRFLSFELAFEPQLGPLWLNIRGSQDAKVFIRQSLAGF